MFLVGDTACVFELVCLSLILSQSFRFSSLVLERFDQGFEAIAELDFGGEAEDIGGLGRDALTVEDVSFASRAVSYFTCGIREFDGEIA